MTWALILSASLVVSLLLGSALGRRLKRVREQETLARLSRLSRADDFEVTVEEPPETPGQMFVRLDRDLPFLRLEYAPPFPTEALREAAAFASVFAARFSGRIPEPLNEKLAGNGAYDTRIDWASAAHKEGVTA